MTPLKMLKKYEKMKAKMEEVHNKPHPPGGHWSTQIKIVDGVIIDLADVILSLIGYDDMKRH